MIYLITGLPGSSKTLNTIKLVQSEFNDRPVYYHNIPELTLDWLPLENPKLWNDLPENSVIVLDECQRTFPIRPNGARVPEHVSPLETHRHKGYDIILITQSPKLLDYHVRDLVGKHYHFQRNFGLEKSTRFAWEQCANDPEKAKYKAVKTLINFDKSLYGSYKSATDHTHKRKLPSKIYFILLLAAGSVGLLAYTLFNFQIYDSELHSPHLNNDSVTEQNKPFFSLNPTTEKKQLTADEYLNQYTPRLADIPSTAPAYDEITKPVSYPKLNCISSDTKCECYTQQATRLFVSETTCRHFVQNGFFDSAKPDSGAGGRGGADDTATARNPIDIYKNALAIRNTMNES